MNKNLSPKHLTQLSDSWVLWFEASNQYLVISNSLKELVDVYLRSENEDDFHSQLRSSSTLSKHDSHTYYTEISELLRTVNRSPENELPKTSDLPRLEKTDFKATYGFGNMSIAVNYCSLAIQNLIHPQWAHATVLEGEIASIVFDILQKDDHLYLFRNQTYIGHYSVTDYHLLQGQFALQLINSLYNKNESDWIATFHASTVCNDKEAIMIIGDSGNGKSTLAALLMANGLDVLADDFSPLSAKNQEVYRFPSGISVKEGAFSTLKPMFQDFEQFPIYTSTSKNVKIKYIPPMADFGKAASHFQCKKIVMVNYDANAKSEMKTIRIEKVLETLIPESWLSPLASNSKLFLDWLKEVSCYELTYSDNGIAVSQFKKLFDS
ncbi:hypothetical protein [Gelidibacter japonicus]|uniref:hypothetical protein n=1 Tax=Gelidibacter japonicus TaxID=1962232 RepID=UPI002AFE8BBA|nr:hypothetical protein [Gelidibacter japonicus]